MQKKIPVIIDCDPGIDDSFALLYALNSTKLDVLCVVSVAGNVSLRMTTSNACNLLANIVSTVPVYAGSESPLNGNPLQAKFDHGVCGLGKYEFKENKLSNFVDGDGIEKVSQTIQQSDQPVTILALGPLTNIAKLIQTYPQVLYNVKEIIIMGGGVTKGNYTKYAEFNILSDPLAANIVFQSGVSCKIVPLETTESCRFNKEFFIKISQSSSIKAQLLTSIINTNTSISSMSKQDVWWIHDMIAAVVLTNPEFFEFEPMIVDVQTKASATIGQTVFKQQLSSNNNPNCYLVTTNKAEMIKNHACNVLTQ